jgi:hypothetical protein
MNTNKWGPSGWDQLGPAALKHDRLHGLLPEQHTNTFSLIHKIHLSNTENILPCKYCRESYNRYIKELPMDRFLVQGNLNNWMYQIHNKVNDKLRKQGYNTKPDPSEAAALKHVKSISTDLYRSTGWDYIHSIGHNYSEKADAMSMVKAKIYLSTLPYMLPHPALTVAMLDFMKLHSVDDALLDRNNLVLWLYLLNQHLIPVYRQLQPDKMVPAIRSYPENCAYYETFRAGCGLSAGKSGPSCRLPVSSNVRSENLKKLLKL